MKRGRAAEKASRASAHRVRKATKPAKKPARKAARRAVKRGAGKAEETARHETRPKSIEDLLLKDLASGKGQGIGNRTDVQDLTLSLTNATRKLGYGFGFALGKQMYRYGNGIDTLFDSLEKLGTGRMLYYPSGSHATITGISSRDNRIVLGTAVHVIESGMIAGYLSGYLGTGVKVYESMCSYMNSDACQFIAAPLSEPDYSSLLNNPNLDSVVEAIAERIDLTDPEHPVTEMRDYLMLPSMPLIRNEVLSESSDVLYLAGTRLARRWRNSEQYKDGLRKIAAYFDLAGVETKERGGKRVIRLKYKQYNSLDGLVRLSSSMAIGFLETLFSSKATIRRGISGKRAYFAEISV